MESKKSGLKLSFKTEIAPVLIILASIIVTIISYKHLPDTVVSHWNVYGEPDGWISKNFHAFFFPGLLIFIYLLMNFLPMFDPKKQRYEDFFSTYLLIRNLILGSLFAVFVAATLANTGYPINVGGTISAIVGILMIILGNYLGKLKRNWFVGIKNPWTLSSENSWNKTHNLGGKLFILWGIMIIALPWTWPQASMWFLVGGAMLILAATTIYSYLIFKNDKKKGNNN